MAAHASDYFVHSTIRRPPESFDFPCIVIVEGVDDCWFIGKILEDQDVDPSIVRVVPAQGVDQIAGVLELIFKSRPFKQRSIRKCAIIFDSDEDPTSVMRDIHNVMIAFNAPTPNHNEIVPSSGCTFGIFTMPGSGRTGDLERLCWETVISNPMPKSIEDFLNNVEFQGKYSLDKRWKRLVQCYLAMVPGELARGAGRGYAVGHFDRTAQPLLEIQQFLSSLLNERQ